MFRKQPLFLPLIAVAVLILLFWFQNQQLKKAGTAPAAVKTAQPPLEKVVDDLLQDKPSGKTVVCSAEKVRTGIAYALPRGLASGRIEFDLLRFHQSVGDELLLFAVTSDKNAPCMPALLAGASISLCMNMKNDTLLLRAGGGTAAWYFDKALTLPVRFLVEWNNGTAKLFINGTGRTGTSYRGPLPEKGNRLILGQAGAGPEPVGADFGNLHVYLPK